MNNKNILKKDKGLETAVLFLVFNRPRTTKKVFDAIRKARPSRLYVAADGVRTEDIGEAAKVNEVRRIATNIDWDCKVKTLFSDQNFGCKMAISNAINWFFEHEDEGIILEDDCLPDQSFFPYCEELLEKYRHDTRIMAISGDNFQDGIKRTDNSYYFSKYNHVWGWASWRRAWKHYDRDILTWPELKGECFLNDISGEDEAFAAYWTKIFDECYAERIDTWDYPWVYSCWIQSGLIILPNVNLVSNIGFGEEATHTLATNAMSEMPTQEMNFPIKHPTFVLQNKKADQYTDKNHYNILSKDVLDVSRIKSMCNHLSLMFRGG